MSDTATYLLSNYSTPLSQFFKGVRWFEQYLGPEDDWIEEDRRIIFQFLQHRYGDYYTFVYHITPKDYVTTVDLPPDKVERILYECDFKRNLVSGRKYRTHHGGGKQWVHGSWAKYYPNEQQHHVFIFRTQDGWTDVYAHYEDDVVDPAAHLHVTDDDDDIVGMKRAYVGELYDIFESNDINYQQRTFNNE